MKIFGFTIVRGDLPSPEPVTETVIQERLILGDAVKLELYRAEDKFFMRSLSYASRQKPEEWHGNLYHSCEQAFAECPGANVIKKEVWKLGDVYIESPIVTEVTVQPKPKRSRKP